MRELKILAVVVVLTLITYWGVEPFAHSQMHPHVAPADYSFSDADGLNGLQGNAENGQVLVESNCVACHPIEFRGFPPAMDDATAAASYGVVPPDLRLSGRIYDENFLAAVIKNPAKATKTEHAFTDGKVHPMPNYDWMQPQEIADIVAYLKSIAPKMDLSGKEVFQEACQRCHGLKYADMLNGTMNSQTPRAEISAYMGKYPPDLSQYIRSRGDRWLHEFINDPQKHLEGTAMPRVGLTKEAEDILVNYMTEVGDSSKVKRAELGPKFLAYLLVFAIFAWLWKAKIWRDVH